MRTAVGRFGGWAVGVAVVVLNALPGSTRSAALGGAGVALVGDAGAMFANPAGIATIHHLSLEGSYEPYLAGSAVSAAALALRVSRLTWGFGAQALDFGSEPEIVPDPATGGRSGIPTGASFHPYEVLATTSLVYRRGLMAFGVTGKYNRQQIGSAVSDAWAGDIGMAIAVFDIMAFGVSVQNLGGDLGGGALLHRRTRAGYSTRPAVTDASRITLGGGVVLGRLAMDYAFQPYDALGGGTHRVGLRWTP